MPFLCWAFSFSLIRAFSCTIPFLYSLSCPSSLTPSLLCTLIISCACSYLSPLSHVPSLFLVPLLFPTLLLFLEPDLSWNHPFLSRCIHSFYCSSSVSHVLFWVPYCSLILTCCFLCPFSVSLSLALSFSVTFSFSHTHCLSHALALSHTLCCNHSFLHMLMPSGPCLSTMFLACFHTCFLSQVLCLTCPLFLSHPLSLSLKH